MQVGIGRTTTMSGDSSGDEPCREEDDEDCETVASGDERSASLSETPPVARLPSSTIIVRRLTTSAMITTPSHTSTTHTSPTSPPVTTTTRSTIPTVLDISTAVHRRISSSAALPGRQASRQPNAWLTLTPADDRQSAFDFREPHTTTPETGHSDRGLLSSRDKVRSDEVAVDMSSMSMNLALIAGIAVAVCILLCMLGYVLYKCTSSGHAGVAASKGASHPATVAASTSDRPAPQTNGKTAPTAQVATKSKKKDVKEWFV